jgi:hypothetical protein
MWHCVGDQLFLRGVEPSSFPRFCPVSPHMQSVLGQEQFELQVKPYQSSLLRKCFATKCEILCNSPRHDSNFVAEVDGLPGGRRVYHSLLVPLLSTTGAVIGVLQVCCQSPC